MFTQHLEVEGKTEENPLVWTRIIIKVVAVTSYLILYLFTFYFTIIDSVSVSCYVDLGIRLLTS